MNGYHMPDIVREISFKSFKNPDGAVWYIQSFPCFFFLLLLFVFLQVRKLRVREVRSLA